MALRARNFPTGVDADLQTANTTPQTTILAGSATLTRYLRSLKVTNSTAATVLTWSFGIGAAAIMTATNSTWFGKTINPGETFTHYWGGKGRRLDGVATGNLLGFASAAGVKLEVQYDESDTLDA
jgi:hypothetical protein